MIAQRTVIGNKKEGGLALIDVGAKRDALRVKLISKFLDQAQQHPWKDFLADCIVEYGERSVYNLCTLPPRNVLRGLPGFYREGLEALGRILAHLRPECSEKKRVADVFPLKPLSYLSGEIFGVQ